MVRKRPGNGRETSWLWSEMIRKRSGIGAKMVENVQKSGQQNLRQKCINHESFKNLLPSWHIFGKMRCKIPFLFKIKTMDEYD